MLYSFGFFSFFWVFYLPVLESEEIANVLAGRIDDTRVLCKLGRQVRRIEEVVRCQPGSRSNVRGNAGGQRRLRRGGGDRRGRLGNGEVGGEAAGVVDSDEESEGVGDQPTDYGVGGRGDGVHAGGGQGAGQRAEKDSGRVLVEDCVGVNQGEQPARED